MKLRNQETFSCDVLVIGGGGAGLRSAIAAKSRGADVLLISKFRAGYASNTYISKSVIAATGYGIPEDKGIVHAADTIKGGRFLNDQSMVVKVAELAGSEVSFLRECGVNFGMTGDKLNLLHTPGHLYPRHVYCDSWVGRDLVLPLKRSATQAGIRFVEHAFVTRLFANRDRIAGAAAVTGDGKFLILKAKTIILATGGYGQVFLNTNNAPGITGDGQALCYDLGIPLMDMEFVQFYPTAMGKRGRRLLLYEKLLTLSEVVLRNEDGEDILRRNGFSDAKYLTRDQLAQIVMKEIRGGSPANGGLIMDLEALSQDAARQLSQILPSRWWKGKKTYVVAPTAHFCMGGIVTDKSGGTSLPGLFAVGEVTAGVHGANRLGGNALAEIFAMGSLVGEKAVKNALGTGPSPLPGKAIEEEKSRLEDSFSVDGLHPKELIHELNSLMWDKAGVIRKRNELEEALVRIQAPWPHTSILTPPDLMNKLEFEHMRIIAEMVCRSALERTESRGSHFRVDHPEEDNDQWLKNIVLLKRKSGMTLEKRPVRLDIISPE